LDYNLLGDVFIITNLISIIALFGITLIDGNASYLIKVLEHITRLYTGGRKKRFRGLAIYAYIRKEYGMVLKV
jgi:hypothetical protein